MHALEPVELTDLELGEAARAGAEVQALPPRVLEQVQALPARTLEAVHTGEVLTLPSLRTLEAVPVYIGADEGGNLFWGGYGPPTSTMPGASAGDYYLDYTSGDVYRLVADDYGQVA